MLWLIVSAILIYLLKDAPRGESLLELVGFSLGVAAGAVATSDFSAAALSMTGADSVSSATADIDTLTPPLRRTKTATLRSQ